MTESKFYHFLKALSLKELRRFRKYLESPYFNSHEKILELFEYFETHLLASNNDEIVKEKVWETLYPHLDFDYDKLRKLQHQLMELGEDFLAQQIYDESPVHRVNYLLQMLHRKELDIFINSAINSGMTLLKREPNRPGTYYYDLYSIEKYRYILENMESARVQKVNIQKLNIVDIDAHLNHFYFAEKLKYYCLLLSWSRMTNVNKDVILIPEIISEISKNGYLEIPAITIYYQIYLTFVEPDIESHFTNLKELIKKYIHLFPAEDARDIINSAINYTIQKQNQGNLKFSKDNFELWKDALSKEIVLTNGELSPWAFKNIVTLALRLNEFDWTESFIFNYGSKISKEYRENAIHYNKASLHFYRKEYHLAIPLLQKVQFDEVNYGLGAKSLLLATYYELDEFDALQSFYDSFKIFIQRNKSITDERKNSYLQLIRFTKRLTETSNDKSKFKKIKEEIQNSQAMSKKWLLEKADELLG
ncbi:MAG: hypothetical protein IPO78_07970 [Saprospiraceae bacterium]|nr:hypothetical protein [Saprospiraceae bacterium]MBK9221517.1 hypothetical protein [Saprospiraceae bacterium]MBK9721545.1 hypothetical protein [Saprospiraceae bacterium]